MIKVPFFNHHLVWSLPETLISQLMFQSCMGQADPCFHKESSKFFQTDLNCHHINKYFIKI